MNGKSHMRKHLSAAESEALEEEEEASSLQSCLRRKRRRVLAGEEDEQSKIFKALAYAFSLASLDDVVLAFRQANGDPNKAAGILAMSSGYNADDSSMSSGSSSREGSN